ncbi:MAG: 3-oxoacyl-(acyl-carrier-protein) synthase [Psychromonas sp.]|jgi:3-oxoacyl-(acyl-carrier-protein) synthase|uniref:beta-ketoacyl synthase chain length factor n=1 Tax=Psychromonas sp. TaxID=1884585 RepID=UPI0039E6E070
MNSINISITDWSALSPGLIERGDWLKWSKNNKHWPPTLAAAPDFLIPPMMRRRMSSLSKLALQCALQVSAQQKIDYIVFSSRHGELTRTVKLIEDIINGGDASPIFFSQSVHNTAAGLFTIAAKRATPATSLAAAENSLHYAVIEAGTYLQENPQDTVLLVNFDQPLPAPYQQFETNSYKGFALAMLLTTGDQLQLSWSKNRDSVSAEYPQAFDFIEYLLNNEKHTSISSKRTNWIWAKN